jgi:hypothetical protein
MVKNLVSEILYTRVWILRVQVITLAKRIPNGNVEILTTLELNFQKIELRVFKDLKATKACLDLKDHKVYKALPVALKATKALKVIKVTRVLQDLQVDLKALRVTKAIKVLRETRVPKA